jgi:lysylphosphatidylglycerol synthetase-like protein (DUF2156 family)
VALDELIPLRGVASKFVRSLLAFVISVGVGTSPLWGGGKIPGYQSILDVFPQDLQDVIPWASILMSITAVGVQFASRELLGRRRIKRAFWATFCALIVLVLASYPVYKAFVVRINVPGAGSKVAYLVGSTPLPSCECAKRGLEIRECIGREISVNPDDVSACFPREQISTRASILSGLYMLLMLALAMLIGLLVLQLPKPKRSSARQSK